jgi:hypothetical protein
MHRFGLVGDLAGQLLEVRLLGCRQIQPGCDAVRGRRQIELVETAAMTTVLARGHAADEKKCRQDNNDHMSFLHDCLLGIDPFFPT